MSRYRIIFLTLVITLSPLSVQAWDAIDTFTGLKIKVLWPSKPGKLGMNGNMKVEFRVVGDSAVRIGEFDGWIKDCKGAYCFQGKKTKQFKLKTFTHHGDLSCLPIDH